MAQQRSKKKGTTKRASPTKRRKRKDTEKEKKDILAYARVHGYTAATKKYKTAYMTIKAWADIAGIDMSKHSRDAGKSSEEAAAPPNSGQTVLLSSKTVDSLSEAQALFERLGFRTSTPALVELAIEHADFRFILKRHVESIQERLDEETP